ncbi:MAG: rplD [Dehalococcoidia bacterium]|nr:rplD [Dehalococcoidia bacterium]
MQVPIKDLNGVEVNTIDLNDAVFGLPMNKALVYQALMRQRANLRQGNASTKTRNSVSGSDKKPWPQKHTGRARAGDKRSPLWRHGGIVFGPHPRTYEQALPKKMRRLAIRCMLSDKQRNGDLIVLQDLALGEGKTKEMADLLKALDASSTVLVVTAHPEAKVIHAANNLERVRTLPAALLNVGDLLKYRHLVMTVDAVKTAEGLWAPKQRRSAA